MRLPLAITLSIIVLSVTRLAAQQTRPAVMEPGPHALINLIDSQQLLQHGQADAIVRFSFGVSSRGESFWSDTYLRSNNSDAFAKEIIDKCERSKWIPAVWHGEKVAAIVSATGIFAVVDGKPRVRIYLNQEADHLKRGDDFISPQPVFSYRDHFNGFHDPDEGRLSGLVNVNLQIDATGKLLGSKPSATNVMNGRGYIKSIEEQIHNLNFVPAFDHGRTVASSTTWRIPYQGWGHNQSWRAD